MEAVGHQYGPGRRGGHAQQYRSTPYSTASSSSHTALTQAPARELLDYDPLVTWCLRKWGWGRQSASEVQQCMYNSVLTGNEHPEAKKIASMGSWGHTPQNINIELRNKYLADVKLPPLDYVMVPCVDPKGSPAQVIWEQAPYLHLHEVLHCLDQSYPYEFDRMFGIDNISEFWFGRATLFKISHRSDAQGLAQRKKVARTEAWR